MTSRSSDTSWVVPAALSCDERLAWARTRGWDDGLGIQVGTEEELNAFIAASGCRGSQELPIGAWCRAPATIRDAAAHLRFSGGEPKALPAVTAALVAISEPRFNLRGVIATTGNAAICLVYQGDGCTALGLHAGPGAFGPRAGANPAVGRAVSLFLQNMCGARPAERDMATIGQPGKIGWCGTEDSRTVPRSWRCSGVTTVTALAASGIVEIPDEVDLRPDSLLDTIAEVMAIPAQFGSGAPDTPRSSAIVLAPEHAALLADGGFDRDAIAAELRKRCIIPAARVSRDYRAWLERNGWARPELRPFAPPAELVVFSFGGPGRKSAFLPGWSGGSLHALARVGAD